MCTKWDDIKIWAVPLSSKSVYYTQSHCSPLDITIPGLSVEEETYIRHQLKLLPALSPAMLVRYESAVVLVDKHQLCNKHEPVQIVRARQEGIDGGLRSVPGHGAHAPGDGHGGGRGHGQGKEEPQGNTPNMTSAKILRFFFDLSLFFSFDENMNLNVKT